MAFFAVQFLVSLVEAGVKEEGGRLLKSKRRLKVFSKPWIRCEVSARANERAQLTWGKKRVWKEASNAANEPYTGF